MKAKNIPGNLTLVSALVSAAAFATTPLAAQTGTNAVELAKPAVSLEPPPYRPWTIGIGAGTDGLIGAGVSWRFSDHFGARLGIGYAEASWNQLEISGINYDAELQLLAEPLTLDYYPWKKHSFRLSVGVMFNQNELSGTVSESGTIIIDGVPIQVEPRSLSMSVKQQPVNLYLSVGGNLFYFDRAHRWALAGELGVAFTGDSRISVDRTGTSIIGDEVVAKLQDELQEYADQYTWWPIAKLGLTFSF